MAAGRRTVAQLPRESPAFGTLGELLRWRARTSPAAECLRFQGSSLTCEELLHRAETMAGLLRSRGVGPGDPVAIMLPNGLDFPVAWFATVLLGAVAVPINVKSQSSDLAHLLAHSGAVRALVGPEQQERLREAVVGRDAPIDPLVIGTPDFKVALAAEPRLDPVHSSAPGDATTIQYTSGTTGLPKGCVLDHRYWIRLAGTFQHHVVLGEGDVVLTAQPQSYMDPSWNLVLTLLAGVPLVILPRFSASTFWRDVCENDVTFFYCIGTMPLYLMARPPDALDRRHKVRLVYCSGIPPTMHRAFEERWGCPWRETYGSTELGVVLLAPPDDVDSVGSGSMGHPVMGRDVRVVDDHGVEVAPGAPGELEVRGPDFMHGYFGDPAATERWRRHGWARTGDVVVQSDDGGTTLVGRKKDMIRRGGENISAAEVEGVLVEHPAVRAAACIPVPDALRGEEVKAYVQLNDVEPTVTPAQLHRFVSSRLASFKAPRYLEFVTSLPLAQSEKVAKATLVASRDDHRQGAWDAREEGTATAAPNDSKE